MADYRFATPEEVEEFLAGDSRTSSSDSKFSRVWRNGEEWDLLVDFDY